MRRPISLVLATLAAAVLAISSACDRQSTLPGPIPTDLTLTLPELILSDGASATIAFVLRDQSGAVMERPPADAMPVWTSSDTVIASVQDGVVVARHPGKTTVSVRVGSLTADAEVLVTAVPVGIRIEGDSVRSVANGEPAAPLVVRVFDRHGEGVPGVKVSFTVESGGGSLSAATVISDSVGLARTVWVPGEEGVQRVAASAASFPAVTFVSLAFTIDGLPNDTVLATPFDTYAVYFSGYVSAPHPIQAVTYTIDDQPETAANLYRFGNGSHPPHYGVQAVLPRGKHSIEVTAVDSSGNRGGWRRTFEVRDVPVRSYSLRVLDLLDGTDGGASDINDAGDVVGWIAREDGDTLAVLWREGTPLPLGDGLGSWSAATGISGTGEVIGIFHDGDCTRSFRWTGGTRSLFDGCGLSAIDVNDRGTVLFRDGRVLRDGEFIDVAVSSGQPTIGDQWAYRINRADAVLMLYYPPGGGCGPGDCSYGPEVIRPPYSSTDATVYAGGGVPYDLNDAGDVVGNCSGGLGQGSCGGLIHLASGQKVTIAWPITGSSRFDTYGGAYGINNRGQVTGLIGSAPAEIPLIPYLWEANTFYRIQITDPGWMVDAISEMNDRGQIAAHAHNVTTGQNGAVLLTPAG